MFPFKLVTFDVTGTLLKPKTVSRTYAEFAKRCGILAEPSALEVGFRTAYKMMELHHPNFGLESGLGWRPWWTSVVKETFRNAVPPECFPADNESIDSVADELIEHYSKGSSWSTETESVDVLRYLKSTGVYLGVISNFDPRLHRILRENDLSQFFLFVLTSYEAKYRKPSAEIFRGAEELFRKRTGVTLGVGEALHVGDNYDLDCEAARSAGWHSILVSKKLAGSSTNCLVLPCMGILKEHLVRNKAVKSFPADVD